MRMSTGLSHPSPAVSRLVRRRPVAACLVAACVSALVAACADAPAPTSPSHALTVSLGAPIPIVRVADQWITEFQVRVSDGSGRGGTVERLETTATTRSGDRELGRNVRPNATLGLPDTHVPAAGTLLLSAGVGLPLQAAAADIRIVVRVTLTDGRTATDTAPVAEVVLAGDPGGR